MSIIIAFTGPAGCGKDTAAAYLKDKYGFTTTSFAGPLKKTASALFGIPEIFFHDRELKEKPLEDWDGLSPRHMLQLLGTEAIRTTFGDNFWIKRWLSDYGRMVCGTSVSITDVRFNNEAQMVRDLGGIVVHIQRPGDLGLDPSAGAHVSEGGVAIGRRDRTVQNGGTIEDLYVKLDTLMGQGAQA